MPSGSRVAMDGASLANLQSYELGFVRRAAQATVTDMEKRWKQREMCKIFMTEEVEEENRTKTINN